jgi:hypothetical protein
MRRAPAIGAASLAALALAYAGIGATGAAAGLAGGAAGAAGKPPNRMLVRATEYNLTLSRAEIGPGPALIQLYDGGEDAHNLQIQAQKGGKTYAVPEVEPGETGSVELRLHKGVRYRLWCSLQNHRQLGMNAKLRVRHRPV